MPARAGLWSSIGLGLEMIVVILLLLVGLMVYRRREGRGSMPAAAVLPDEPAKG